ncbi:MAG: condensation domain-containing protein [Blastocatellia bacterium]
MSANPLVSIERMKGVKQPTVSGRIFLTKPPYFTPWTPPLGISILKTFLEQNGYGVRCYDYNIDSELWGMHHKYFAVLQTLEDVSINDGYSKLWWILNAHMLAYANGASHADCTKVLEKVIPRYGIEYNGSVIDGLVRLVDKFYKRLQELTNDIDFSDYSVVGTSTYTTSLGPSLFILKNIKQSYPHITTVMGGGVFADDLALGSDNLNTLVEEYAFVDHAILGEGELLFLKLLQGELSHKRVISIADLKGTTLNMVDVPSPDFSDLNSESYYHLTIEGARSCPFQCSFCSETVQWGDYRKKPANTFADQVIDLARRYNSSSFFMGDSLMNPYINPFATELIGREANILYDGYLRADKPVTNRKFVKMWSDSGLYRVRLGIESAASRVLDAMDKMTTPQVISDALKTLAGEGIRTTTYWIVGFPGETEEDFQETCQFIRDHHQYIYELEAHPYYYYPYGQIGSRLYQCQSLYPDDVTDIIKFRVWDIIDADPPREVRYDRLRRISKLAADLGLPNIYTMAERYQAEDRWFRLHPLATEVYQGTRLCRDEIKLPDEPVDVFYQEMPEQGAHNASNSDSVFCYQVSVKETLDEKILSDSIARLIASNDVLRMRLQDGKYVAVKNDNGRHSSKVLSACELREGDTTPSDDFRAGIIKTVSAEMKPEPGDSLRVALVKGRHESYVIALAHKAMVDGKSVTLILEDLFRIYKQLINNKEVSLRPIKSYADFIKDLPVKNGSGPKQSFSGTLMGGAQATGGSRNLSKQTVLLDNAIKRGLFSKTLIECGLKPVEAFTQAALKSLTQVHEKDDFEVDMKFDYRAAAAGLEFTVGPLTVTSTLSRNVEANSLLSDVEMIRNAMSNVSSDGLNSGAFAAGAGLSNRLRMLLNLEYLTDEPWLGSDEWTPHGFVLEQGGLKQDYLIEVTPTLGLQGIKVHFSYEDKQQARKIVEALTGRLAEQLKLILHHCERYVAARHYWTKEFLKAAPESNIESDWGSGSDSGNGTASFDFVVKKSLTGDLKASCGATSPAIILAIFAALLSRLNGREDIVIVTNIDDQNRSLFTPLRLYPLWRLSFKEFARKLEQKFSLTSESGEYALDVLSRDLPASNEDFLPPTFDVGFTFGRAGAETEAIASMEARLNQYPAFDSGLDLILSANNSGEQLGMRLTYKRGRLGQAIVTKISNYIDSIVEQVSENPLVALADIRLGEAESKDVLDALAKDSFSF